MDWFRMYAEFATDAKVQRMSEAMQRRLIMLFCLRCSNVLETLQDEDVAFQLRIDEKELEETRDLFTKRGFIDNKWNILHWESRQWKTDNSTARVQKHRANLKKKESQNQEVTDLPTDVKQDETVTEQNCHATVTAYTQIQIQKQKEQTTPTPPPVDNLLPKKNIGEDDADQDCITARPRGKPPTPPTGSDAELPAVTAAAIAMAVSLRKLGVNATFTHADVHVWATEGVTGDILAEAVRIARETKGPTEKLAPGYLAPIVRRLLNPPPVRPGNGAWKRDDASVAAMSAEMGLGRNARVGEYRENWIGRIAAEIKKRGEKS